MGVDSGPALPSVTVENSRKSSTLFLENGNFPVKGVCYLKQLEVIGPTPLGTHMERCGPTPAQLCTLSLSPDHRLLAGLSLCPAPVFPPWGLRHVSFMGLANRRKGAGQTYPLPVLVCTCLRCVFCVLRGLVCGAL